MAISVNSVFEVRPGSSDTNGGGFVTGAAGTDYSQQNNKNTSGNDISTTNAVSAGTTTITSATANFSTAIVGNIINLSGGSGSLASGWYQVTARASTTSITIDRNVASGTGITMNIGGALASMGGAMVAGYSAGNIMFVLNNGTAMPITSATANVSGGVVSTTAQGIICGYTTNRTITNTDATLPLIQYGVTAVSLFATRSLIKNLAIDGNGQTVAKLQGSSDSSAYRGCTYTNINSASSGPVSNYMGCSATACSITIFTGQNAINCVAQANTATPFQMTNCDSCISYNNTGATTDGFNLSLADASVKNSISFGNGRAGFQFGAASRASMSINNIAENNTTWGYDTSTAGTGQVIQNCAHFNNTSGGIAVTAKMDISGVIAVTAGSVFTNAAAGDFSLNNTVGQGALLRAAGAPALFPLGLTASFLDVGASQHQDTGGGGNNFIGFVSI